MHAIALTSSSVCWPVGKDKQPVNFSSKQFVISHYPDSRRTLCFPLLPRRCAKRRENDEGSHLPRWAKPGKYPGSLSATVQERACPKALFGHLCHKTELFTTSDTTLINSSSLLSDRTLARKCLGSTACKVALQPSTDYYPRFEAAYFSISLLKERNIRPISASPSTHLFKMIETSKDLHQKSSLPASKNTAWPGWPQRGDNKSLPRGLFLMAIATPS